MAFGAPWPATGLPVEVGLAAGEVVGAGGGGTTIALGAAAGIVGAIGGGFALTHDTPATATTPAAINPVRMLMRAIPYCSRFVR